MAQIPSMVFAYKYKKWHALPPRRPDFRGFIMQGEKKTKRCEARRLPRFAPARSITVSLLNHDPPFAFEVVINISEGGACVQTGEVSAWSSVHMMLSFCNGEMLEVSGRVVWSKPLEANGSQTLYGIEFTGLSEGKRETLRTILDSPAFFAPDGNVKSRPSRLDLTQRYS